MQPRGRPGYEPGVFLHGTVDHRSIEPLPGQVTEAGRGLIRLLENARPAPFPRVFTCSGMGFLMRGGKYANEWETKCANEWETKCANEWETKCANEWETNKRINECLRHA